MHIRLYIHNNNNTNTTNTNTNTNTNKNHALNKYNDLSDPGGHVALLELRVSFVGWSKRKFKHIHFIISLEKK